MEALLTGFLENLLPIILSILGTAIVVLGRGLVKKYGTKLDIETRQRTDDLIASLTHQGVAIAEQWAKRKAKTLGVGDKVEETEKLHMAMEYISQQIEKNGLDKLVERELGEKIEAILGLGTLEKNAFPEPPLETNDEPTFE